MKFRVEREFQRLSLYCKDKNMEFRLKAGNLYVKTAIGCWKLVYRDDLQNFALYHRNDTGHPADFEHPEWETYHNIGAGRSSHRKKQSGWLSIFLWKATMRIPRWIDNAGSTDLVLVVWLIVK